MAPNDRYYSKEHEWIIISGTEGTVGISDHAQKALKDIVFIELPTAGKKLEQGKPFCVIESVKSVSDVYSPVNGEVIDVNDELDDHPELVNESPYDKGWIAKVKITSADKALLMTAEQYEKLIAGK
ncbi:MAG: glycine cleavage system protein GcvH [archaeon]